MTLIEKLKKIELEMEAFVSPDNKEGFYREFVLWVYETWSTCEYFEAEVIKVGSVRTTRPVPSGELASEKLQTYKDFINSSTGTAKEYYTFASSYGFPWGMHAEKLGIFFEEACGKRFDELAKSYDIKLPEKHASAYESFGELVFDGGVFREEEPEIYDVCEDIKDRFGHLGTGFNPYSCVVARLDEQGELVWDETSIFRDMTLDDFRKLAEA